MVTQTGHEGQPMSVAEPLSNRLDSVLRAQVTPALDVRVRRPWLTLREALMRFQSGAQEDVHDTGRYRCRYISWGNGPPLIFVHGLADVPASFVMPMAILSRHFHCVAYSLPDGCDDGANLRQYAHHHLVSDLLALLDHLGIHEASLFGSSFGSTVTLAAMHAAPRRIGRAILQGGFARRPLRFGERVLTRLARYWPGPMRRMPLRAAMLLHKQRAPLARQPREVREHLVQCTGTPSIRAVMRRALMMDALDLRSILPKIEHPVLVVCGEKDPIVGKECEAELLHGLPRARRVGIPGCAHFPYYSHPETLAGIVQRFLSGHRGAHDARERLDMRQLA
jgi:pimeloyl-ACP methyl ester carboxylesterase